MTPEQHQAIMQALMQQELLLIQAGGGFLIACVGLIIAFVHQNTGRINRQGQRIHSLENGGGEKKIIGVINDKIVDGTIQKGDFNGADSRRNDSTSGGSST